jgi:hypothetical protein
VSKLSAVQNKRPNGLTHLVGRNGSRVILEREVALRRCQSCARRRAATAVAWLELAEEDEPAAVACEPVRRARKSAALGPARAGVVCSARRGAGAPACLVWSLWCGSMVDEARLSQQCWPGGRDEERV